MNYKRIIKSRSLRFAILRALEWIPDSIMVRMQYRIKMGFWPDMKHPRRFTEKLQLYKLCYHNPVMSQCVDKYEVRKFVESKGLGHILNELYGIYNHFDDIDFETLPDSFVIKSTTGGGGLNVIIVNDKHSCDIDDIRRQVNSWYVHKQGFKNMGREWAYIDMPQTRIIIEKLLQDNTIESNTGLSDYKMMFFNGKFKLLWIDKDRYTNHHRGFWNERLEFMSDIYSDHDTFSTPPELPDNIMEMVSMGEKLAEDFPYARIDLYNVEGKVVFGEITFYPWSGYVKFHPDEFDFQLGEYFTEY